LHRGLKASLGRGRGHRRASLEDCIVFDLALDLRRFYTSRSVVSRLILGTPQPDADSGRTRERNENGGEEEGYIEGEKGQKKDRERERLREERREGERRGVERKIAIARARG